MAGNFDSINIYCQDESRFGLLTRTGRVLTARGVKPICLYQHKFEYLYLFGAFSVLNGNSFLLELPFCNADTFQCFLDEFAKQQPRELKVLVLDNGAFHKAKSLVIPENILLIFLPPYSPELNPAEKVWWVLKREFICKTHQSIEELQNFLTTIINNKITIPAIKQLCSFDFYACAFQTNL